MTEHIINIIKANLTALPYVARFGGLAKPVTRMVQIADNVWARETFPVTCGVTAAQCWEDQKYLDLVPNDLYASIFYFEEITNTAFREAGGAKNALLTFETIIRLVGWLNLPKLGETACSVDWKMIPQIIKAMRGDYATISPVLNGRVGLEVHQLVRKSPDIFSQYSYDNTVLGFLLYPFDYFAIDFRAVLQIPQGCFEDYTPGEVYDCLDLTAE